TVGAKCHARWQDAGVASLLKCLTDSIGLLTIPSTCHDSTSAAAISTDLARLLVGRSSARGAWERPWRCGAHRGELGDRRPWRRPEHSCWWAVRGKVVAPTRDAARRGAHGQTRWSNPISVAVEILGLSEDAFGASSPQ